MTSRPLACPILIGRDRELAVLHDAKRGLSKSRAAIVLVAGEAGIGKSRLLAQFVRGMASERTRNVASVECLAYASAPLGPIRELLAILARSVPQPLPPALAHIVDRSVAGDAIEKTALFVAIVEFLRACAHKRATVVTIEDVHWADAMTLEFLGYAASRLAGTRVLIVATYRSSAVENALLSAAIARLMREPITFRIELDGLARADVRELIRHALDGHATLPAPAIERVVSRAEGNPFFAEELLKDTLGERVPPDGAPLPLSIRESIVERLRSFEPAERAVIDQAAVLGLRFDPEVLALTLQTGVDAILPTLRKARGANLIVEEDGDGGRVRFRFRHALTRQAVYDELLLFDARRTHRRILAALESLGSEMQHLEELAYHAWEARDPEKALRYNERAADTAFALQALPEARLGYERALELATERRDQARLLERLCRITALLGDLPQAISLYETAYPLALEIGDFDAAARLTRWTVGDRNNSGDASALGFGLAFLERWGERVSTGARDELLALLARLCTIEHEIERATRLLEQIAEPQALPPPALQNVLAVRFDTAWYMGDIGAWTIIAEQWLALLPSLEPFSALIACYSIAQGASYHARDDLVARALAFADRIEARSDYGSLGSYGAAIRALDLFARGKLGEARAKIRTALAQPNIHVATAALALVAPFVADALDDDELITPQIDAEFALVRAHVRHVDEAAVLGAGAFWSLRNGRRAGAVADLRRALDVIARPIAQIAPVLLLAAQHLPVGELGRLDWFCELAASGTDESVGRAHALALAAIIAQRRGDVAAATALGASAAQLFGRLNRPLLAAQASETAGDAAAARALYAQCGAVAWLKRLGEPAAANGTRAESLSDRQREVARLVAAGLNNVEIGERLAISTKTVEKHIASIYDKLGVRTRPQVALLVSGSSAQPAHPLVVDSA